MSLFKSRKKSLTITKKEPTYKVRYLGNVQTAMMKGDGCVDRPTAALWNNYLKTSSPGIEMKLYVVNSGLKVSTKQQGITEYWANRITYCIAHPTYPRLFVWVYRHEGKKLKSEIRCHAALCHSELKAKQIAVALNEKVSIALQEFLREKTRRQNSRLTLQKTNSWGSSTSTVPLRKKMLSPASFFKSPIERSSSAPKLGNISESEEGYDRDESGGINRVYQKEAMYVLREEDEESESSESDFGSPPLPSSPIKMATCNGSSHDLEKMVEMTINETGHKMTKMDNDSGDDSDPQVQLTLVGEKPGTATDGSIESGFFEHESSKENLNSKNTNDEPTNNDSHLNDVQNTMKIQVSKTNGVLPNKANGNVEPLPQKNKEVVTNGVHNSTKEILIITKSGSVDKDTTNGINTGIR